MLQAQQFLRNNEVIEELQIGSMTINNESVLAADSVGVVTVNIPVSRTTGKGMMDFKPIQAELRVAVDSTLNVTSCVSANFVSIDPAGLGRDGWLCSCNGDFTSSTEGGTTICMHQQSGRINNIWVAPDPWTKSTGVSGGGFFSRGGGGDFNCNRGRIPNPPGAAPVLKWRWNYYSRVYERCNMTSGSMVASGTCPPSS